jgi:hypothetical protein
MKKLSILLMILILSHYPSSAQELKINDKEYFETRGVNLLVFSNQYTGYFFDEKTAGIELIHHGVRTATGGGVRLQPTPEQWDQIPMVVERKVDRENNSIEVLLRYNEFDFNSRVKVEAYEDGAIIQVILDEPLSEKLVGHAGFNMEFLPSAYFEKTYLIDGKPGIFPLYPTGPVETRPVEEKIPQFAGHSTFDDKGRGEFIKPLPIVEGKVLTLAPEDPERLVTIKSLTGNLMLYDGRNLAQNGWYVVRSLLPAGKKGVVLQWFLKANSIKDWIRKPVITYSQTGYHPGQNKIAVIELDKNDEPLETAALFKIDENGNTSKVLEKKVERWGEFLRYKYVTFDFTDIKESGLYSIKYGDIQTKPFPVSEDVYKSAWHATLDVWFPVQMDHMFVNEAYRVWHGLPSRDDARQAPVNHIHFDGYSMGPSTDTKYKSGEHIPGLDVGGWFDAGDFDIQTGHHCTTVMSFVDSWEHFKIDRDQTYIDQKIRYTDIHHPDGKPDLLQQIEHGTLQLVAQHKSVGHAFRGIVVPNLHQYHHLGDPSAMTDNMIYNPEMDVNENDGKYSGVNDDRWAFTGKDPSLNYSSMAALAAAYRALKGFNDSLASEALSIAENAWIKEHNESGWEIKDAGRFAIYRIRGEVDAALQLLISTGKESYKERFENLIWNALDLSRILFIERAVKAIPYFDSRFKERLVPYVEKYKTECDEFLKENPYGVLIGRRPWAGNHELISWAITNYHVHKAFPDIMSPEYTFRGLSYIYGLHPSSNISFVSGVGVHSKKVAYGGNRADYTFIAGGVVPGLLMLKPDFPENKEDWPFLWGENEYVIDICAEYIFLVNAVDDLLNGK